MDRLPTPTPHFLLDVETGDATHQGMEKFIAHVMRLSRESKVAPAQIQKWLEGKGRSLGWCAYGGESRV